jgi:hypothetical protein
VTEKVRTLARRFDTRSFQRTPHDLGDRVRDAEPDKWSTVTNEEAATRTSWTGMV